MIAVATGTGPLSPHTISFGPGAGWKNALINTGLDIATTVITNFVQDLQRGKVQTQKTDNGNGSRATFRNKGPYYRTRKQYYPISHNKRFSGRKSKSFRRKRYYSVR